MCCVSWSMDSEKATAANHRLAAIPPSKNLASPKADAVRDEESEENSHTASHRTKRQQQKGKSGLQLGLGRSGALSINVVGVYRRKQRTLACSYSLRYREDLLFQRHKATQLETPTTTTTAFTTPSSSFPLSHHPLLLCNFIPPFSGTSVESTVSFFYTSPAIHPAPTIWRKSKAERHLWASASI